MNYVLKLAAIFIAASTLAACSGASGFAPPAPARAATVVPARNLNAVTVPCELGQTSQDGCIPNCVSEGKCAQPPLSSTTGPCVVTCGGGSYTGPSSYDPGAGRYPIGGGGICQRDPSYCSTQVAIYTGPPTQNVPCPSNDGSNSLAVGATVGYANINGGGQQARSVADINAIYGFAGTNIINSSSYYTNLVTVGWVYKDNNGAFWFQQNSNLSWTYSLGGGITVGNLISGSFGINSPPGKSAVSIGSSPGKIQAHEVASPCFSQGGQFFPGEILA